MTSRTSPPGPKPSLPTPPPEGARRSHALEAISAHFSSHESLHVLDLGGINQANLDFVTGFGHRLYAEDLVRSFDGFFSPGEISSGQFTEGRITSFLDQTFDFPDQSCDAAFVWDALQFLPSTLAQAVLDRLHRVLAPDSLLLACFHPDSSTPDTLAACPHSCRILDTRHLLLVPRPARRPIQPFNTRAIERFFHRFQSVKFFLTRENLQEVIARR